MGSRGNPKPQEFLGIPECRVIGCASSFLKNSTSWSLCVIQWASRRHQDCSGFRV